MYVPAGVAGYPPRRWRNVPLWPADSDPVGRAFRGSGNDGWLQGLPSDRAAPTSTAGHISVIVQRERKTCRGSGLGLMGQRPAAARSMNAMNATTTPFLSEPERHPLFEEITWRLHSIAASYPPADSTRFPTPWSILVRGRPQVRTGQAASVQL